MPEYSYICDACGIRWCETSSVANRLNVECGCGRKARIDVAAQGRTINVAPDDLWNIPMTEFTGKPITVRSRRHFNELCRLHGKTEVDRSLGDRLPTPEVPKTKRTERMPV